jgi:hypothetical protein
MGTQRARFEPATNSRAVQNHRRHSMCGPSFRLKFYIFWRNFRSVTGQKYRQSVLITREAGSCKTMRNEISDFSLLLVYLGNEIIGGGDGRNMQYA